jgi:hypothetical protein
MDLVFPVKECERSSPLSASSAISSAVGGFGVSSAFGMGLHFFTADFQGYILKILAVFPQGLKPTSIFVVIAARLRPCPFKASRGSEVP